MAIGPVGRNSSNTEHGASTNPVVASAPWAWWRCTLVGCFLLAAGLAWIAHWRLMSGGHVKDSLVPGFHGILCLSLAYCCFPGAPTKLLVRLCAPGATYSVTFAGFDLTPHTSQELRGPPSCEAGRGSERGGAVGVPSWRFFYLELVFGVFDCACQDIVRSCWAAKRVKPGASLTSARGASAPADSAQVLWHTDELLPCRRPGHAIDACAAPHLFFPRSQFHPPRLCAVVALTAGDGSRVVQFRSL
jgi:hypothetical protein